ncbi:MAG: PhoH family protein [Bacteroidales bacterium]
MTEILIDLNTIHPVDLFGLEEEKLARIQTYFPTLKLIARGNELKAIGDTKSIAIFQEKFAQCLSHFEKMNRLSNKDMDLLFGGDPIPNKKSLAHSSTPKENATTELAPLPTLEKADYATLVHGMGGRVIKALTSNQQGMVDSIEHKDMLFAIGPAGSGKTYTAVALAVRALKNKEVKRIVLTRPAVEAGENLGFLPGDLKDKLDPYLQPLYDALRDMLPPQKLQTLLEEGIIEIAPLAFMRGRTLDHAFVILDEAQNATESQMKMFLTRMGKSAKFIITGDITQIDLPRNQSSGLVQAVHILKDIQAIDFVFLTVEDVVRHKLVTQIIQAYAVK